MRILLLASLALTMLTGCAGYTIGGGKPTFMKGIDSIAVLTFRNKTLEPRVEVLAAGTVIKQFQQDGTYTIRPEGQADAILEGTVLAMKRSPVRSVRGNVLATREFELEIELSFRLYRRGTGEDLDNGTVSGVTSFFVSDDLQQDERQGIPLALEEAAVRLVSRLSEGY